MSLVADVALVPRILLQIRIGDELGGRNREEVQVRVSRCARGCSALPRPDVIAPGEQAKPDEVRAAMCFPEQLATTLVEDELRGELGGRDVAAARRNRPSFSMTVVMPPAFG